MTPDKPTEETAKTQGARHSPGPWRVNGTQVATDGSSRIIFTQNFPGVVQAEELIANAVLVGAVLDLLAAAKAVEARCDCHTRSSIDAMSELSTAIAKAEGRKVAA